MANLSLIKSRSTDAQLHEIIIILNHNNVNNVAIGMTPLVKCLIHLSSTL